MALFHYLTFTVLLMLIGAPIAWIIGRRSGRYAGIFALLIMLASLVTFGLAWTEVVVVGEYWEAFFWGPFLFGWLLDGLSVTVAGIVLILTTAATCFSIAYMSKEHGQNRYYALLLLYNAGILGVVLATNLFQFYIFWELMLIPSYFLIAEWGTKPRSTGIALKYFIFTHIGAVLIIVGIAGMWSLSSVPTLNMYDFTGSTPVINLSWAFPPLLSLDAIFAFEIMKILIILFTIGFAVKMAIFPLHTWLPDAHAEAPTPISVILSGVMIETAAYAIIRILMTFMLPAYSVFVYILMGFGLATMIYGGIMALVQKDTKRLFAYSSVSQMGYIFLGLGTAILLGVVGATFHIFTHALGKGLLFMVSGVLILQIGHERGRDINAMGGLARKMPWTATIALIAGLSIAGTPPLAGFLSEFIIFGGAGLASTFYILIFAVASTALTAGYILWFVKRVFFGATPNDLENITDSPLTMRVPMILLALFIIILGIWPWIVLNPLFGAITWVP
ncbi:MAG: NuoM family protein [Candidatus Hermodarchaeota archaeon]